MYSSDLIGSLYTLLCCGVQIVIVVGVLALIINAVVRRNPSGPSTNTEDFSNTNILEFLKKKKAEGKTTIDELIQEIEQKSVTPKPTQQTVPVPPTPKPHVQTENLERTRPQLNIKSEPVIKASSAEVLLYLGSFLITFAMLVLVALGWSAIPGIVKSIILIVTVMAFYIGGFLLIGNQKLKKVGLTYLTVASIATPLVFLGVWNFNLGANVSFSFSLYWTIVSILVVTINVFLLKFVSRSRFFYILQIAIYSLIISLAFTLTDDSNFRIVIISILNLVFYASEKAFGNYSKEVRYVSRAVNFVLNFVIFIVTLSLLPEITTTYQKVLATAAILIPTIFVLVSYFKDKALYESGFEIIFLALKMILIGNIFGLDFNSNFVLLETFSVIYIVLAELVLLKKKKNLYYISLGVAGIIFASVNLYIALTWLIPESTQFSREAITYLLSLSLFSTLFVPLKRNMDAIAGVGLLYSVFAFTREVSLFTKSGDFTPFIYSYLILGIVLGSIWIFAKANNKEILQNILRPTAESLSLFALFFVWYKFNANDVTIVYLALTFYYLVRSLILGSKLSRVFAYFLSLIGYFALLNVLDTNKVIELGSPQNYSLAFLFPTIGYFVVSEIKHFFRLDRKLEDGAIIYFAFIGLCLGIVDEKVFWINLFVITLMMIVRFIFTLSKTFLGLIYFMMHLLIVIGMNILAKPPVDIAWTLTIVNMIFLLGSSILTLANKDKLENKIFSLFKFLSLIAAVFSVLITISTMLIKQEILWINLLSLLIYSIIKLIETKTREIIILSFILLQSLVILGCSILDFNEFNTILAVAVTTLITASIGSLSKLFFADNKSDSTEILKLLNDISVIFSYFILALETIPMFASGNNYYSVVFAILGLTSLISNRNILRKFAGIPFVLAIWNINKDFDVNMQFYIIPVTLYGLVLSYLNHLEGKKQQSLVLEVLSYSFEMTTLLFQSMLVTNDMEKIISGVILIAFSVIIAIVGLFRNKKEIWITASIFLLLELIIRLYQVIILIPWWAYVGLIGIGLIALASYIIYRSSEKK